MDSMSLFSFFPVPWLLLLQLPLKGRNYLNFSYCVTRPKLPEVKNYFFVFVFVFTTVKRKDYAFSHDRPLELQPCWSLDQCSAWISSGSSIKISKHMLLPRWTYRVFYAKWNKSDRERRIQYYFICIWNRKNKINKQNRNRLIKTENRLMVARWEGCCGAG